MKTPAFQYYPADFLSDQNVLTMTAAEVGAYWLLVSVCWREDGLKDDLDFLSQISRIPKSRFLKSWESKIKTCFTRRDDGKWTHNRLDKERVKQQAWRDKSAEGGRASAAKRLRNGTKGGSRVVQPMANSLSSTTSIPFTNVNGGTPPPLSIVFGVGVQHLVATGVDEQSARGFLGKQVKAYGDAAVALAVTQAMSQNAVEPKAYIVKILLGENGKPERPLAERQEELQQRWENQGKKTA